jgi:hypothetical protein
MTYLDTGISYDIGFMIGVALGFIVNHKWTVITVGVLTIVFYNLTKAYKNKRKTR